MCANKKKGIIGFYLIKFSAIDPRNYNFLTSWNNNLDIDNLNMFLSRGDSKDGSKFKELIISYKTIFINTYTVVTKDLCGDADSIGLLNQHESF
jgi:hypothetical protein